MPSPHEDSAPGDETSSKTRSTGVGGRRDDAPDCGPENEPSGWSDCDYDGIEPHHNLD
ncbi:MULTISPECIES: hypothetical protein [Kitasatospora]|uniref:Uncharacterized protein n=1 Tax=Kitasatospora cystarginea TaxID=58350 RepID=A0ABN3DBD9_9ACTN